MKHIVSTNPILDRLGKWLNKLLGIRSPSEELLLYMDGKWHTEAKKRGWGDECPFEITPNFDRPCDDDGTPATTLYNVTVEREDDRTCVIHGKRYAEIEEAS